MSEFFTLQHMNQLIVNNLHYIRSIPFDVIVHIPRSGTIPASLIATYLCKPFQSIDEFCARLPLITRKSEFETTNRILVVDDSIHQGIQLKENIARIRKARPDAQIQTLSIYDNVRGKPTRQFDCDYRLFEHGHNSKDHYFMPWFLWKTSWLDKVAVDMDGVLCRDCTREEDDDAQNYQSFLESADLKFKPLEKDNIKIGAIVTGRLEKYRPQTEAWLKAHKIKYKQLLMMPANTKEERKALNPAIWKGKTYASIPQSLFVESSIREAQIIRDVSCKTVYCIDNSEVCK
jgi:orotate phosphoribosyltransferase